MAQSLATAGCAHEHPFVRGAELQPVEVDRLRALTVAVVLTPEAVADPAERSFDGADFRFVGTRSFVDAGIRSTLGKAVKEVVTVASLDEAADADIILQPSLTIELRATLGGQSCAVNFTLAASDNAGGSLGNGAHLEEQNFAAPADSGTTCEEAAVTAMTQVLAQVVDAL